MRRLLLLLVPLVACIPNRPKTLRELHNELDEVGTAQSAELAYRSKTPDVQILRGMKKKNLVDELGPGQCVPRDAGLRCGWPFSTQPESSSERPLWLRLDFDAKEICVAAQWADED